MEASMSAPTESGLNLEDRDVALLAIQAADEIDELRTGKASSLSAVRSLAVRLKDTFADERHVDSGAVALFYHALDDSQWPGKTATIQDLVVRADEVAGHLEHADTALAGGLENVRRFCLALANVVIGYRQSTYTVEHDFRS